jgi:hypothetical protein
MKIQLGLDSFGQSNVPPKYIYAEAWVNQTPSGLTCSIDFGNENITPIDKKDEIIKKVAAYKNPTDIMNYMNDLGWEYLDKIVILHTKEENGRINTSLYWILTFRKLK